MKVRLALAVATVLALVVLGCGRPPKAERGTSTTSAVSTAEASSLPTTSDDPAPIRVAMCVEVTDGDNGTINTAQTALTKLAELVDQRFPADPLESDARPALEVQIRPIVDRTIGSSFAQTAIVELAIPALPKTELARASGPEGTVSAADLDREDEVGQRRERAINASRGWSDRLRKQATELSPSSSNATHNDIVGCAFAARDWLLRGSPRSTTLLFLTTGEVGDDQDIAANPYATVLGLAHVQNLLMLSACPTNDRCEFMERSWNWFTDLFAGRKAPFVKREPTAAFEKLQSFVIGGSTG